jgi:nitrile hydratase accessory protein
VNDGPVFSAPWQVQAWALQSALRDRGLIGADEWAQALGAAIRRAQQRGDPDDGSTYWQHWLDALESLLVAKGLATADVVHALEHAWAAAAERTPHGQPIVLSEAERALARPQAG